MNLKEFASYRQKTNVGLSLVVSAPLGEYDKPKLINLGSNRWGFKSEVGLFQGLREVDARVLRRRRVLHH